MTQRELDSRALALFSIGVLVLFVFFVAGTLIGRWSRPPASEAREVAPPPPAQRSGERFVVEVAVVDTREKAEQIVTQLRRQYTSARLEFEPSDRAFHVYVGPYTVEMAGEVAGELTRAGTPSVSVKPYHP